MEYPNDSAHQAPRVIETASATTSPDNEHSGVGAYAIAALAIAFCLGFGFLMRGCMSLAVDAIKPQAGQGSNYDYQQFLEEYLDEDFDYDDEMFVDGQNGNSDMGQSQGMSSQVVDILAGSLGMFDDTIDAHVPASDYANTQRPVSEWVRSLVLIDRDATNDLARNLRAAAWDSGDWDQALADAKKTAEETAESLRSLELPEVTGDKANDVTGSLTTGRDKAVARWEAISAELDLLSSKDDVDTTALSGADAQVTQTATEAAQSLSAALRASVA